MNLMRYFRFMLFPLTPVYIAVVKLRNFLFDKGILKQTKVSVPVISVGNLTVGGTGKTPFTIFLAKLLKEAGKKPAILSRGYGRKQRGYILVSDGKNILATTDAAGDEIVQTVQETGLPAAVCEKRVEGAGKLIEAVHPDVILLDDGFQHRYLNRDINILLFDQRFITETSNFCRRSLPAGEMREPLTGMDRADIIFINRKFRKEANVPEWFKVRAGNTPVFTAGYRPLGLADVRNHKYYPAAEFEGQRSLMVCGIAEPGSFITALEELNIKILKQIVFKDHAEYTLEEVQEIRKQFYASNSDSVITTQKDAVKLTHFARELDDIDIYYLHIELYADDEQGFREIILKKLKPGVSTL